MLSDFLLFRCHSSFVYWFVLRDVCHSCKFHEFLQLADGPVSSAAFFAEYFSGLRSEGFTFVDEMDGFLPAISAEPAPGCGTFLLVERVVAQITGIKPGEKGDQLAQLLPRSAHQVFAFLRSVDWEPRFGLSVVSG